jgi:hypothetical protein
MERQEESKKTLRAIQDSMGNIQRSIGSLSKSVADLERGSTGSVAQSLDRVTKELQVLESALKEHIGSHVGTLSANLLGRGGFWKGIWVVVGTQAACWIVYEVYRSKKDKGKKFL